MRQGNRPSPSTFQSGQDSNNQERQAFSDCSELDLTLTWRQAVVGLDLRLVASPRFPGKPPGRVQEPDWGGRTDSSPGPIPPHSPELTHVPYPEQAWPPGPPSIRWRGLGISAPSPQGPKEHGGSEQDPTQTGKASLSLSTAAALRPLERPVHQGSWPPISGSTPGQVSVVSTELLRWGHRANLGTPTRAQRSRQPVSRSHGLGERRALGGYAVPAGGRAHGH